MTEFYKLARPMMYGVKVQIKKPLDSSIKNRMMRDIIQDLPAFVGEIVVGPPADPECKERTEFLLNEPDLIHPFIFWVYDMKTTDNYTLRERLAIAEPMVTGACPPPIQYVDHALLTTAEELSDYTQRVLGKGFPGIVLREPFGTFGTYDDEIPAESLGNPTH